MSQLWLEPPHPGTVARARIRSPADACEVERVAHPDLLPCWSILGLIEATARVHPNKDAIVVLDRDDPLQVIRRLSYAELAQRIRDTAAALAFGMAGRAPKVAILTPLVPEAFIALWAGATVGTALPVNLFLRADHVAEILSAAQSTHLVCGPGLDAAQLAMLRARVPSLQVVWRLEDPACPWHSAAPSSGAPPPVRSADPDRTVALFHTGGTTAAPKLVRHTERGQLLNAWATGALFDAAPDAVVAVGMPYFHVGGAINMALSVMVHGQTMVIVSPDGYRNSVVVARFWELVQAHGITLAGFAPTTAAALVAAPATARPPTGVRCWSGGATVPVQVAREFADRFGIALHEGWGMTELHGGLILNPQGVAPRLGSIGFPFPYHRACCLPVEDPGSAQLQPGALGVLAIRGPCVTPGYLDSRRDAELFVDRPGEAGRWLLTGDLCTLDADGYLWIRGRSKDLIIRGGHNIDPLTIEAALTDHPAVLHAAAIGAPHREKGEVPIAYVQLRPSARAGAAELLAHCRQEITERAAVPVDVRILETMPVTAVGKIFKPALRLDAVRRCVEACIEEQSVSAVCRATVSDRGGSIVVQLSTEAPEAANALRQTLERFALQVELAP